MAPRITRASSIPAGLSVERTALSAFLRGTAGGWGKRDLATWLVCHYAPCLAVEVEVEDRAASSHRIDEETIEQIILGARSTTLRLLSDLAWPSHAAIHARAAVAKGHVIGRREGGELLWSPVGRARMRLGERIASLVIADCMNSPQAYRSVTLCRECSELGFSADSLHAPGCSKSPLAA